MVVKRRKAYIDSLPLTKKSLARLELPFHLPNALT
jgi:hypothetical protein